MFTNNSTKPKAELITARCDKRVKNLLQHISRSQGISMSEVISESIREYHQRHFATESFFAKEAELFGKYGSEKGNLSTDRKQYLTETLREKHRRH